MPTSKASTKIKKTTKEEILESKEELLDYLRQMYEIRNFEDTVYKLLREGTIKGASHLYAGQEAVAVGAIACLEERDVIASTHRGHGHCGAMGDFHAKKVERRQGRNIGIR